MNWNWVYQIQDAADLGLKAHVQHAVRLVEHEVCHAAAVGRLGLHLVYTHMYVYIYIYVCMYIYIYLSICVIMCQTMCMKGYKFIH